MFLRYRDLRFYRTINTGIFSIHINGSRWEITCNEVEKDNVYSLVRVYYHYVRYLALNPNLSLALVQNDTSEHHLLKHHKAVKKRLV